MFRNAIFAGFALAVAALGAQGASAQQQQDQQTLVAGTVDCRFQVRPVDSAICGTPVLAAMDLQMLTLFKVLEVLVKPETATELAVGQETFLKARETCGGDADCIGQITANRIGELDRVLKDIASRGPY